MLCSTEYIGNVGSEHCWVALSDHTIISSWTPVLGSIGVHGVIIQSGSEAQGAENCRVTNYVAVSLFATRLQGLQVPVF